tara:strand:+ start:1219 stop:1998 length:780 start_codon:yes stop_codon:yes gene_type:complete
MSLSKALGRNVEKVFSPMRHSITFPCSSTYLKPHPLPQSGVTEETEGIRSLWCGEHIRFHQDTEEDHLQYIRGKGFAHYIPICYSSSSGNIDGRRNIYRQSEEDFISGKTKTMTVSRGLSPNGHWSSTPPALGDIVVPYIPRQEKGIMNTKGRRGVPMIGKVVGVVDYHREQENNTEHWNNIKGCEWLKEQIKKQKNDGHGWKELGILVEPLVYSGFRNPIIVKDENGGNVKWAPRTPSTNSLSPLHLTTLYKEMKDSM